MKYDVIVVGGGHAGCEASLAAARLNTNVLLITSNINNIADMPCNPSIGGPAKGIITREIDALGGEMGINADKSILQMKLLNTAKGPAVQALRAQIDKVKYPEEMINTLNNQDNLSIKEAMVKELIVNKGTVEGVILETGEKITSKAVILTTGTYMKSSILVGDTKTSSGPHGEPTSNFLSINLKELGFNILRLKTGTPPRIAKSSINFDQIKVEPGDQEIYTFSYLNKISYNVEEQEPCHLVYTTEETHKIIEDHLKESSMYGGHVEGVGPRYCPSIEDKIVRFKDKERHQLFLEPESLSYDDIYIQGFSTSMPQYVQDKMIHSIKGLENAIVNKYAYAIEYDAIDSRDLKLSLETKIINNLFTAGQINGTSGYEEAAGQGLIAGINAVQKIKDNKPLILKRNEAYIGVLIDDLITKGVKDPYRMLTSRAEYRLLLRNDNADLRLTKYGIEIGLVTEERETKYLQKYQDIENLIRKLQENKLTPIKSTNDYLESINSTIIKDGITFYDLLKRPEIKMEHIENFIILEYSEEIKQQVETLIRYEGYIKKAEKDAEKMLNLEDKQIPEWIKYSEISNLASEARQKLEEVRPIPLGQASRISGVNPADISILMVYLRKNGKKNE